MFPGPTVCTFVAGLLSPGCGYDEPFAFFGRFPSPLQELDPNGAIELSVAQCPPCHHDISPLMDFIDHNIFDMGSIHLCVPLGFWIGSPQTRVLRRREEEEIVGRWQT